MKRCFISAGDVWHVLIVDVFYRQPSPPLPYPPALPLSRNTRSGPVGEIPADGWIILEGIHRVGNRRNVKQYKPT